MLLKIQIFLLKQGNCPLRLLGLPQCGRVEGESAEVGHVPACTVPPAHLCLWTVRSEGIFQTVKNADKRRAVLLSLEEKRAPMFSFCHSRIE